MESVVNNAAWPSESDITAHLTKLTQSMDPSLAARRAYCYNCNEYKSDLYSHRQTHPSHKMFALRGAVGPLKMNGTPARVARMSGVGRGNGRRTKGSDHPGTAEMYAKVQALRSKGVQLQEIASMLSISRARAHYLMYKPAKSNGAAPASKPRRIVSVVGSKVFPATPVSAGNDELRAAVFAGYVRGLTERFAEEHGISVDVLADAVIREIKQEVI